MRVAFPKPKQVKRKVEAVRVYPDGREVCSDTQAGRLEYVRRRELAWRRQGKLCAICHRRLLWPDAESDHIKPRGMGGGRRDDRQMNIQAVCWKCNMEKGSKRGVEY